MRATLQLRPHQRTEMRVSQRLVSFATTLALDAEEVDALVDAELSVQPALERDDAPGGGFTAAERDPAPPDVPAPRDPRSELATELAASLPTGERPLARLLTDALDDRGFLDGTPEELAGRADVPVARVRAAIAALQTLGPVGLATRGPLDCIRAQLAATAGIPPEVRALAQTLLEHHLAAVAAGDLDEVAARLGVGVVEVDAALDAMLLHTRPTPCWDAAPSTPSAAQPADLVVDDAGDLRVVVVERQRHRLRLSPSFLSHAPAHPDVARARAFLDRMEDRWRTLGRVGEHVIRRQAAFVRDRRAPLEDLSRTAVADDLGLHPSTVSRAVTGRVVRLPDGRTTALARLFASGDPARRALRELLEAPGAPRSDAALARALADRGHRLARRTVAKYRAELGVPARGGR